MADTNEKPLINTKNFIKKVSSEKKNVKQVKKSVEEFAEITPNSSEEKIEKLHDKFQSEANSRLSLEIKRKLSEPKKVDDSEKEVVEKKRSSNLSTKSSKIKSVDSEDKAYEKAYLDEKRGASQPSGINQQKSSKIIRNQSDIFSLKKEPERMATSIFSVNGSPSRKVYRNTLDSIKRTEEPLPEERKPQTAEPRVTRENYNDEKRPSSSYRNPLTGSGLTSNDEYKSKGYRRKDGNPLLGLGYDSEIIAQPSSQRIPPGGFSHKIW